MTSTAIKKTISICIPVYNEFANLPIAIGKVEELFENELATYDFEIIITDNSSTDATWTLIKELATKKSYIKGYQFSRNFGYQNSVYAGICLATGDAVVELDADLEDPPRVIAEFVCKWEEGYDIVYGVRQRRYGNFALLFFIRIFYILIEKLSELKLPQNTGDFRLLDRKVVDVLKSLPERNLYIRGLISYLGFRQYALPYERDCRISGYSKFCLAHYIVLALDALTAFTKYPLRLSGVTGICLFLISLLVSLYYLCTYLMFGNSMPGFVTLVILILGLHGITFIFLGIQAEYLSRIFDDAKHRPRVVIREAVNDPEPPVLL